MKSLFIAICIIASSSVFAESQVCKTYEFAELNTYSDADLAKLLNNYQEGYDLNSKRVEIEPRYVRQRFDDLQNCKEEIERVTRIIDSRKKTTKSKKVKAN